MLSILFSKVFSWFYAFGAAGAQIAQTIRYRGKARTEQEPPRFPEALRVLFVHRDLPFHGGVPRCLLYLARASDCHRIDFRLASFVEPSQRMKTCFGQLGIKPHCLGDQGYYRPAQQLRTIVREEGIDVLVATTFKAYLCSKWAVRGMDVRVVFWMHAVRGTVEGFLRRTLLAILVKRDAMMFVSRAVSEAQRPRRHRGLSEIIYNGVEDVGEDPEHKPYSAQMREPLGLPQDALVLAYIAEFIGWKDHPTIIAAAHELSRRNINAHLLLIGTGENMGRTKALSQIGPANHNIHFLGPRSDARRILGLVDIYIHPSRGEGFGLAVVEAMLAQCPVVAAREGAMAEYVESGKTGLLFTPADHNELVEAIVRLSSDRAFSRQLGVAAREYCLSKFNIDTFADEVCAFLEKVHPTAVRRRLREAELAHSPQVQANPVGVGA
jgi:glycosyltransferase involved in cell wall biosynthesis